MAVDSTKLGQVAAELMEMLEEEGIDGALDVVAVVVSVEGEGNTHVRLRCSDDRGFVLSGLLRAALAINELRWEAEGEEED